MKSAVLVALLVVSAVVAGFLFFGSDPGGTSAVPGAPGAAGPETASGPELGAEKTELALDDLGPDPGRAAASQAAPAASVTVFEGRVRIPAGVVDPQLAVYAQDEEWGYGKLVRGAKAASAPVDAQGRFRIELAGEKREAWLLVRGRYLFTLRSARVRAGSATELVPEVGACLVVTVGLAPGIDATERADARFSLASGFGGSERTGQNDGGGIAARELLPDGEGRFEVPGLPCDRGWFVHLSHPRLTASRDTVEGLEPGRDRDLTLTLARGGIVAGQVVDGARAPVADAEVHALLPARFFGLDGESAREGKSDAEGRFELAGVPAGSLRVKASAKGYLPSAEERVEVVEGGAVRGVHLALDPGGSIAGRVLDPDGSPVEGVPVKVEFDRAHMVGLEALAALRGAEGDGTSGPDGRFSIGGLGRGPFVVSAEHRRAEDDAPLRALAEGVAPGTSDLVLSLGPPIGVAGRVLDEAGAPVTEFELFFRRQLEGGMGVLADSKEQTFESPEGRFFLAELAPGAWKVWVVGPTHVSREPVSFEVVGGAGELDLVAPRGCTLRGVVVDPAGAPVATAEVGVGTGSIDLASLSEGGPEPPHDEADAEGLFELPSVAAGSLSVVARGKDWAASAPLSLELAPGEVRGDLRLVLTLGGRLTGEVYGADGQPASGRMVTVMGGFMESGGAGQRIATTDEAGAFVFEHLSPGTWQVVAMDTSQDLGSSDELDLSSFVSTMKMAQAEIHEGETTHVVLGAPPADPVHVFGRVTLAGEPIKKPMITFHREGEPMMAGMTMASADDDGRYEVELPAPGAYLARVARLSTTMQQQSTVEFEVSVGEGPEQGLDFALPLGRIAGRTVAPDGSPAPGERVTLTAGGPARSDSLYGPYTEILSDDQGRFEVTGLRAGVYQLSAGGTGFFGTGGKLGRVTLPDITLEEGEGRDDLSLRLPRPGSLAVVVHGAGGAPESGATVFLRDASGRTLEPFSFLTTDGSGRCLVAGLAPGEVTVLARSSTLASREAGPVTVVEGEERKVELTLESGAILIVELKEKEGDKSPVSASVNVTDERGREYSKLVGLNDLQNLYAATPFSTHEYRVGPIPPGKYTVVARSGELEATKLVTIRGDEGERRMTLRLK